MITIHSAEFIKSAPALKDAPDLGGLPELVMVGRSNVGKSSFINSLTNRKSLAKTSNTPGKTRLMNFYRVNNQLVFVDLPGYGFAKVSKAEQEKWRKNLENYLTKREAIRLIIQLIDSRHGPQDSDLQMQAWLQHQDLPQLIILTKADKISKNEMAKQRQNTSSLMDVAVSHILPFSAESHLGRDQVWEVLRQYYEEPFPTEV